MVPREVLVYGSDMQRSAWMFIACSVVLACESEPNRIEAAPQEVTPIRAARTPDKPTDVVGAKGPNRPTKRLKADALWQRAKPVDASRRRALTAFFHGMPRAKLRGYFGANHTLALSPAAESTAAKLRKQDLRLVRSVQPTRGQTGVYVDAVPGSPAVKFRLVWPIALGAGLQIVARKPVVQAATGSAVPKPLHTWLFDYTPPDGWLDAIRRDPSRLEYRAVWRPAAARTRPFPTLQVRVVRWQVWDRDTLLHEETDDR